jgi:biopolymer transport protein ExbD
MIMSKRKTSLIALREISEINMTPLMDLTFILLITFIITFPLIEQGIPVDLPKGSANELKEPEARSITVDANGNFFLDDLKISREELAEEIRVTGQFNPDAVVYVRADKKTLYEHIAAVMQMLHDAQITRMALVTQAEE